MHPSESAPRRRRPAMGLRDAVDRAAAELRMRARGGDADALAGFEKWPPWIFYGPVAARVLWRGLQHGDLSLPALANPLANEGGIMGSSKSRVFAAMTSEARGSVAPYVAIPGRGAPAAASTFFQSLSEMKKAGLDFPLVAKPDRGARGQGVRIVHHEWELRDYVVAFPAGQTFLLQQLVDHEHEAGIMYARHPAERAGRITYLACKHAPAVRGDGSTTLRGLIERHPRVRHHRRHALARHEQELDRVPARGELIELVFTRSHCAGATCRDARSLVTPDLTRRVDAIARSVPCFHIGRLDVRFASEAHLQRGEFTIIEMNGGASEPLHAWDSRNGVLQAWHAYFEQIDLLYQLGAANRAAGYRSVGARALLRDWARQHRLMRRYPARS